MRWLRAKWLKYCVKQCRARETFQRHRMHAALVRGGALKAQGCNLPASEGQLILINPKAPEHCGIHAEIDCIRNAAETDGATLYVAGVARSGKLLKSQPCVWCMAAIADSGIAKVVWHDELGVAHTMRRRAYAVP